MIKSNDIELNNKKTFSAPYCTGMVNYLISFDTSIFCYVIGNRNHIGV